MNPLIYFCYQLRADTVSGPVGPFETSEIHQLTGSGNTSAAPSAQDRVQKARCQSLFFLHSPHETCKWVDTEMQTFKGARKQTTRSLRLVGYTAAHRCSGEGDMMCLDLMFPTHTWLIGCICQQTTKWSLVQQISKTCGRHKRCFSFRERTTWTERYVRNRDH